MSDVLIQSQELDFLLWDWIGLDRILQDKRFAAHDRQAIDAMLDLSTRLAENAFLSHYKLADQREPHLDEAGQAHVLPEVRDALRQYSELGLFGAGFPEELGGLGLPSLAVTASMAQFMAANVSTSGYPMLTAGAARLIAAFGAPAQVDAFARPLIAGDAFGTMCLSEPQAGSSLADIRTRAVGDGEDAYGKRYRLFGNKMWISGGDQDISDNIIHMVLAKVPLADGRLPEGSKGISLFITPKRLPDGARNDIAVAGLNHKMGYRGTTNCLLNFGEGCFAPSGAPGAIGYLVGAEGQGLAQMFQMMNEARINVGLGAAALAYRGYRHALRYARERVQGRALSAPKGAGAPIALIEHPDVQRMLLAQKVYAEGALALTFYCAGLVDEEARDPGAGEVLALLTPVAKTWPSEWGLAANDLAIQVHGGYGYTRDFDVEQLYRDNRLNPIHEGATAIQALDLLGRKLLGARTPAFDALAARVAATRERARAFEALAGHANTLERLWDDIARTLGELRAAEPARALAHATAFLSAFGHSVVAWIWLDLAACVLAQPGLAPAFAAGKLRACRYFFESETPKVAVWLASVRGLSDVAIGAPPEEF